MILWWQLSSIKCDFHFTFVLLCGLNNSRQCQHSTMCSTDWSLWGQVLHSSSSSCKPRVRFTLQSARQMYGPSNIQYTTLQRSCTHANSSPVLTRTNIQQTHFPLPHTHAHPPPIYVYNHTVSVLICWSKGAACHLGKLGSVYVRLCTLSGSPFVYPKTVKQMWVWCRWHTY